ncbi:MAG: serine racemase VanT catalytic subunit [Oscillospiraceae bacterium]
MEENRQFGGLDAFKIPAALLVIAIHTSPLSSFSAGADFVLTRIIARIAVPFFLMVTGYFLLPQYLSEHTKDLRPLGRFFKKALLLYGIAVVLYLPVNLYAGQLRGAGVWDILRMLLFDGTLYHLWYLPASLLGVLLVFLLSRKLPFGAVLGIALALYGIGLLGDSYYGLFSDCRVFRAVFDAMFHVFPYTRNGIFYAPIFLVMGAEMTRVRPRRGIATTGFLCSMAAMIAEGLTLHHLDVQRHDSMYLALLPCMFFLFPLLLSVELRPSKRLRTISMWMYLIHPMFIILVRGAAKLVHLEGLLIENSMVHYLTVCLLSAAFGIALERISSRLLRKNFEMGRAWIELDRENLRQNVDALRELLPPGCQLMPAVKANAYGHGAVPVSRELNRLGVRTFCVATVSEGVELRRGGVKGEILVLGYTHPEQIPLLRRYRLTQTVVDSAYAQLLDQYGKKIKVHLKIDTGMHRLGERAERLDALCGVFSCKNLKVTGAYTHLCCADTNVPEDRKYTEMQGEAFRQVVSELEKRGHRCGKTHLLASYGLLNYPELGGDYARVGIALYGVLSNRTDLERCPVTLRPVLSLKARVVLTKQLRAGEGAGYGLQHVAQRDETIAVLAIGYADGLPRALSCGHGRVLLHGAEAPVIGRICMDQTLIDVTEIPNVNAGDIAVIIGRSGQREITVYDLAEETGTITNEVLSRLGTRLERTMP